MLFNIEFDYLQVPISSLITSLQKPCTAVNFYLRKTIEYMFSWLKGDVASCGGMYKLATVRCLLVCILTICSSLYCVCVDVSGNV